MPPPLLSTLSGRARQAYPIIRRGVREGLSGNQIQTLLRAADLGIRRLSMQAIVRAERGVQVAGAQLRFLNRRFTPDPRRIPEALTTLRRAFSFTVRIRGVDTQTGEDVERFVNISINRPISRASLEQIGFDFSQPEPEQYGLAVTEVLLIEAVKAGPAGTLL